MKKVILSTLAATALLASSNALADGGTMGSNPTAGSAPYLSVAGGLAWTPDIKFSGSKGITSATTEYNLGGNSSFAIGYRYTNWRADVSLGYIYNGVDKVKVSSTKLDADGHVEAYTYLINGYYDINTTTNFIPYIGAGLGGAHLDYDDSNVDHTSGKLTGTDNVLAYQGILGAAYQFTPNLRGFADYHYFRTASHSVKATNTGGVTGKIKEHVQSNLFNIGISYMFNM